jgi:hypothetical protein
MRGCRGSAHGADSAADQSAGQCPAAAASQSSDRRTGAGAYQSAANCPLSWIIGIGASRH